MVTAAVRVFQDLDSRPSDLLLAADSSPLVVQILESASGSEGLIHFEGLGCPTLRLSESLTLDSLTPN